jgi:hypothetical protein
MGVGDGSACTRGAANKTIPMVNSKIIGQLAILMVTFSSYIFIQYIFIKLKIILKIIIILLIAKEKNN